jgi:glycosyltransferase involved in cell wall biosynthesis
MKPFFTIIIPTYNAEKLLSKALDSVLEQSYHDYEVIIMDGLSSDNTFELAQKYAEGNPQIKIFREKDTGIYDAMNKAVKISQGKFLFFLGSDDVFYDDKVLKNVAEAISKKKTDVIYGNVFSTRFNGLYDGEFTIKKLMSKNICHQAIFLNKSVFDKIGDFNLKYKIHSDYDHNIRWFCKKSITKQYTDLTISNYADGGFSSLNNDLIFQQEKISVFKSNFETIDLIKYYYGRFKINIKKVSIFKNK